LSFFANRTKVPKTLKETKMRSVAYSGMKQRVIE